MFTLGDRRRDNRTDDRFMYSPHYYMLCCYKQLVFKSVFEDTLSTD